MHLIQKCYALGNMRPECVKVVPSRSEQTRGSSIESNEHTLNFPTPHFCEGNVWFKINTRWNPNLCPATGLFRLSLYFRLEHHVIQRCSFGKRYGVLRGVTRCHMPSFPNLHFFLLTFVVSWGILFHVFFGPLLLQCLHPFSGPFDFIFSSLSMVSVYKIIPN